MEFKKLSGVTLVEEATDVANVLIEEDGAIKRVPKTQVGGAGGKSVIIFKSGPNMGYTCNYTFEEVLEMYNSMDIPGCVLNLFDDGFASMYAFASIASNSQNGEMYPPAILTGSSEDCDTVMFAIMDNSKFMNGFDPEMSTLYYHADGTIEYEPPHSNVE